MQKYKLFFPAYIILDVWLHADGAKDLLAGLHS